MIQSLIWDLLIAGVMIYTLIRGYRSGFLSALIRLLGALASYLLAALFSSRIAAWIYDSFIAGSVKESVRLSFDAKVAAFTEVWKKLGVWDLLNGSPLWKDLGISDTVSNAANDAVRTVAVSLLTFAVFIAIFFLAGFLVHFLVKATRGVNRIPIVGGVNRALGGAAGAAEALLDAYIIAMLATVLVSFSGDKWNWVNSSVIENSHLLSWLLQLKLPL